MFRSYLIGCGSVVLCVCGVVLAQSRGAQINVGNNGQDIAGDAANEVSAVMYPRGFNFMAAGWREFADKDSSLPAAGYAFSFDGGKTWTFPGTITHFPDDYDPAWVSDPVLTIDDDGLMHYVHLIWTGDCSGSPHAIYMSHSADFGQTWVEPREIMKIPDHNAVLDKPWVTTDTSTSSGHNNLYVVYVVWGDCANSGPLEIWSQRSLTRGDTWEGPIAVVDEPAELPVCAVDADGDLYCVYMRFDDETIRVKKSVNAKQNGRLMSWDALGGSCTGLIGQGTRDGGFVPAVGAHQPVIAIDTSGGPHRNNVYVAWAGQYQGGTDTDIAFARSVDGGCTWIGPTWLNTDHAMPPARNQYLPAMDVAPDGRIDIAWYDFRNSEENNLAEIFYRFSKDGGVTWSLEHRLTPQFDVHEGHPLESQKIGEYITVLGSYDSTRIIYTGTYEGEQNLYCRRYVHHFPRAIGP